MKNMAVTASAALPPWPRIDAPVFAAKGSSATARPVVWAGVGAAAESSERPSVELTVEHPLSRRIADKAGAAKKPEIQMIVLAFKIEKFDIVMPITDDREVRNTIVPLPTRHWHEVEFTDNWRRS